MCYFSITGKSTLCWRFLTVISTVFAYPVCATDRAEFFGALKASFTKGFGTNGGVILLAAATICVLAAIAVCFLRNRNARVRDMESSGTDAERELFRPKMKKKYRFIYPGTTETKKR
jgi:hypothetical protein